MDGHVEKITETAVHQTTEPPPARSPMLPHRLMLPRTCLRLLLQLLPLGPALDHALRGGVVLLADNIAGGVVDVSVGLHEDLARLLLR